MALRSAESSLALVVLVVMIGCQDSPVVEPPDPLYFVSPECDPTQECADAAYPLITEEEAARLTIEGETEASLQKVDARTYVPFAARIIPAYWMSNEIKATLTADRTTITKTEGPDRSRTGYEHRSTLSLAGSVTCATEGYHAAKVSAETKHEAEFQYTISAAPAGIGVSVPYQKPASADSDDSFECDVVVEEVERPIEEACNNENAPPDPEGACPESDGWPGTPGGGGGDGGGGTGPPPYCIIEITYYKDSGLLIGARILRCYY